MKFKEAIVFAVDGKKITRSAWVDGPKVQCDGMNKENPFPGLLVTYEEDTGDLAIEHMDENDWIVIDP